MAIAFFLVFLVVIIDQLIKLFVKAYLQPIGEIDIIHNFIRLIYVENRGAAFGILENRRWIFISITIMVIFLMIYILWKYSITKKLLLIASALIIGGGIGNLIDRIFYGYVVDYIQLSFFSPVCNFADYCVVVGATLLCLYFLFVSDRQLK